MLLSKTSIESKISSTQPLLSGLNIASNIQSSSIDLTVDEILLPDNKKIKKQSEINDHGLENYKIKAGETVIIQVSEQFTMPLDVGGIVFPRNILSKKGLLMTNPGHIDPGFRGKITVCLINMAGDSKTLKKGDTIITLLLFKVDATTPGYNSRTPSAGVSIEQLNSITKDFANISGRMRNMASKQIWKNTAFALGVFSVIITIMLFVIPLIFTMIAPPSIEEIKEGKINKILITPLSERVKTAEDKLDALKNNREFYNTEIAKQDREIIRLQKYIDKQSNDINALNQQLADFERELRQILIKKK